MVIYNLLIRVAVVFSEVCNLVQCDDEDQESVEKVAVASPNAPASTPRVRLDKLM